MNRNKTPMIVGPDNVLPDDDWSNNTFTLSSLHEARNKT